MERDEDIFLNSLKSESKDFIDEKKIRDKAKVAISRINKIIDDPTDHNINLAIEIFKILNCYEEYIKLPKYALDKAMITICNKNFNIKLFEMLWNRIMNLKTHFNNIFLKQLTIQDFINDINAKKKIEENEETITINVVDDLRSLIFSNNIIRIDQNSLLHRLIGGNEIKYNILIRLTEQFSNEISGLKNLKEDFKEFSNIFISFTILCIRKKRIIDLDFLLYIGFLQDIKKYKYCISQILEKRDFMPGLHKKYLLALPNRHNTENKHVNNQIKEIMDELNLNFACYNFQFDLSEFKSFINDFEIRSRFDFRFLIKQEFINQFKLGDDEEKIDTNNSNDTYNFDKKLGNNLSQKNENVIDFKIENNSIYKRNITFNGFLEREFHKAFIFYTQEEYLKCKNILKDLLKEKMSLKYQEIQLHILNILVGCHYNIGDFYESIFYLDKALELSCRMILPEVYFYFLNFKFEIERIGGFSTPEPYYKLKLQDVTVKKILFDISKNRNLCNRSDVVLESTLKRQEIEKLKSMLEKVDLNSEIRRKILNSRILVNYNLLEDKTFLRELRTLEFIRNENLQGNYTKNNVILSMYENILLNQEKYSILSLFCVGNILFANNMYQVTDTGIDFVQILENFNNLLLQSKETLQRDIKTKEDKGAWWIDRINIDNKLQALLKKVNIEIDVKTHVILVLDEVTTSFPWEYTEFLEHKHAYRVPSIEYLTNRSIIREVRDIFYILDPEDNLKSTREIIGDWLKNNVPKGSIGRKKENSMEQDISNLSNRCHDITNYDMLLYFGHGNGLKYIRNKTLNDKILFLFGCSSVKMMCVKNFKRNSKILRYLINNSTILGCLWEVTDKDLDRITINFLNILFSDTRKCISCILKESIKNVKLKYLNGCSIVIYGLPLILTFRNNLP